MGGKGDIVSGRVNSSYVHKLIQYAQNNNQIGYNDMPTQVTSFPSSPSSSTKGIISRHPSHLPYHLKIICTKEYDVRGSIPNTHTLTRLTFIKQEDTGKEKTCQWWTVKCSYLIICIQNEHQKVQYKQLYHVHKTTTPPNHPSSIMRKLISYLCTK